MTLIKSVTVCAVLLMALFSTLHAEDSILGIEPDPNDPHFAFYTIITDDMSAGQVEWDPATQSLPKSTQVISKIALESFTPAASQAKSGWKVTEILLRQVPATWSGEGGYPQARKNKWFCQIRLAAPGDYKGDWWKNSATIYIFLDGTIIKPERRRAPDNWNLPKNQ